FMAILFTDLRRQLRTTGPYAAAFVALVIFSPFVIWNIQNHYPHLEFMRNAVTQKYNTLTRRDFLSEQFLNINPFTFLVSLPGLYWCLFDTQGKRFRAIGVIFLVVFAILLANPHTKAEYVSPAYPSLFACGGVILARISERRRAISVVLIAFLVVTG